MPLRKESKMRGSVKIGDNFVIYIIYPADKEVEWLIASVRITQKGGTGKGGNSWSQKTTN